MNGVVMGIVLAEEPEQTVQVVEAPIEITFEADEITVEVDDAC